MSAGGEPVKLEGGAPSSGFKLSWLGHLERVEGETQSNSREQVSALTLEVTSREEFAYQSLFDGPFLFANGHSFDAGAVLLIVRATVVL